MRAASASAVADAAGLPVALDLGQLVAIDGKLVAAGGRAWRPSGHSTAKTAAAVISAKMSQSVMMPRLDHVPVPRQRGNWGVSAAL